jgi:hypothetical protein
MSVAQPARCQAYCPVCGEPLAPGARNPARYCGDGACRQAAHKRKKRLKKLFLNRPRENPVAAPDDTLAAMALRARFGPGVRFSAEQALIVAGRSGVHLDPTRLANMLRELVQDVLQETVTPSGLRFSFPSTKRPSLKGYAQTNRVRAPQPKRGARAGASHGVTVTSRLATPPAPTPSAPQAPAAPKALGRKAVVPDPLVKLIGPPTVDGFTSFKLLVKEEHWAESLRHLVAASASGGRNALPPTVDLADADGEVWTAIVRYGDHGCVSLEFSDEAQLDLYAKQGFADNAVLQRIKLGKAVHDDDLEELARLVLEIDDKANVKQLAARSALAGFRSGSPSPMTDERSRVRSRTGHPEVRARSACEGRNPAGDRRWVRASGARVTCGAPLCAQASRAHARGGR